MPRLRKGCSNPSLAPRFSIVAWMSFLLKGRMSSVSLRLFLHGLSDNPCDFFLYCYRISRVDLKRLGRGVRVVDCCGASNVERTDAAGAPTEQWRMVTWWECSGASSRSVRVKMVADSQISAVERSALQAGLCGFSSWEDCEIRRATSCLHSLALATHSFAMESVRRHVFVSVSWSLCLRACLVLSCLVLSCLVLSCLVLSCLVWSRLVLVSCGVVLWCLVLSCRRVRLVCVYGAVRCGVRDGVVWCGVVWLSCVRRVACFVSCSGVWCDLCSVVLLSCLVVWLFGVWLRVVCVLFGCVLFGGVVARKGEERGGVEEGSKAQGNGWVGWCQGETEGGWRRREGSDDIQVRCAC